MQAPPCRPFDSAAPTPTHSPARTRPLTTRPPHHATHLVVAQALWKGHVRALQP